MAVPKRKVSKSRRNMRRAHDSIKAINITFDSKTGEPKLPHHISLTDGYYNGRQVFLTRSHKRAMKAQAAAQSESGQNAEDSKASS